MHSNPVASKHQPEPMFWTGGAFSAALADRLPVCLDVTAIAGATFPDGSGLTIPDVAAVGSYFAAPSAANAALFAGVTSPNAPIAKGDAGRIIAAGPCRVAVRNGGAASLTLTVGTYLYQVPGQSYLIPLTQPNSAASALILANYGAFPRAIVTKEVAIAATTTSYAYVFLFPATAPRLVRFSHTIPGTAPATQTAVPLGTTPGYGFIAAVGLGVATGGNAGSLALDILLNAVSCLTTAPSIVNDCVDPFHTLSDTAAGGSGAGPGTAGVYGLVNSAANTFAPRTKVTYTLTNTSSFVGTHVNIEALAICY